MQRNSRVAIAPQSSRRGRGRSVPWYGGVVTLVGALAGCTAGGSVPSVAPPSTVQSDATVATSSTVQSDATVATSETLSRCHDDTVAAIITHNGGDAYTTELLIQVDPGAEPACTLSGSPSSVDALFGGNWTSLVLTKPGTAVPNVATSAVPLPGLVVFAATPMCPADDGIYAEQLRIRFDDVIIVADPDDDLPALTVGCDGVVDSLSVSATVTFPGLWLTTAAPMLPSPACRRVWLSRQLRLIRRLPARVANGRP